VDSFLIPSALNLMMSQRLIPKLCQKCRKSEPLIGKLLDIVKKELDKMPAGAKAKAGEMKVYHSVGCSECNNKGVSGRIAMFEVLRMTPELEAVVNSGPTELKINEEAKRQGMITLRQDGILKALDGLVSIEEVIRETSED